MSKTSSGYETCKHCGNQFRDGDGIAGIAASGIFEAYDFDCATELGIEGDLYGNLIQTINHAS